MTKDDLKALLCMSVDSLPEDESIANYYLVLETMDDKLRRFYHGNAASRLGMLEAARTVERLQVWVQHVDANEDA